MKNKLLSISIVLCSLGLSAQVQIDRDIQLNGASGNRDITGAQTIDVSVGYLFGNNPGTSGQVLRSNGTTGFVAASIVASDLPDLSGSYIKNQTTQQTGANFNVAGTGVIGTTLRLDDANANNGTTTNALIFGAAGSGEGIGSKRTATGNQFGLDFYTNGQNRMAITNGGNVGIGTTTIPTESRLVLGALGGDKNMTIAVQHSTHSTLRKSLFALSVRELEVLQLAAEGLSNKEIAEALFLSCDTIDTHNRNLIGKLRARNMKNAIAIALRTKLIQ